MVKNKKGGSGHKKMARKNVAPKGGYSSRKLRKPQEEGEIFARITGIHGGGQAGILCSDGKERTLVIRGKFRGRNKRDNTIKLNSIVMVALRSVTMGEVVGPKKKEKADLIYVYNENQIDELKEIPEVYQILDDTKKSQIKIDNECGFDFTNQVISVESNDENKTLSKNDNKLFDKKDDIEINWDEI